MSLPATLCPERSNPSLWLSLDAPTRQRVNTWTGLFSRVLESPRPLMQLEREAQALAGLGGFSVKTMQRHYYALLGGADWTVFVPKTKLRRLSAGVEAPGQPPEFVEYWHGLCLVNKRKIRPAFRLLERQWREGVNIPGYGTWRDWWRKTKGTAPPCMEGWNPPLPHGVTYSNLIRLKPAAATLAVAREGRKALAEHRPLVLKTREGMVPGQMYMFDDVWWDNRCRFGAKDVRPLELGCMDVASAMQFAWGMRPLLEDDWTKKKQGIKESEMRFLLASVLTGTGFHRNGVTLIAERGTAAIREELAERLHDLSGGLIKVERGGLEGGAFLDQFRGQSTGNSRFKALKESLHNLLHNEAGNLPAQMGKDRQHKPQELYGLQHYNQQLMLAAEALPERYKEMLIFPVISWDDMMRVAAELYANLHDRTDHNLEGWEENGNTTMEWRFGEAFPWLPRSQYLAIAPAERAAVDALLRVKGNTQTVRLSPKQVWQQGQQDLVRLPVWCAPLILGDDKAKEIAVAKDHTLTIRDRSVCQEPLVFPALLTDKEGKQSVLPAGETYAVFHNPFAPDTLVVADARGAVLGTLSRDVRASYLDAKGLAEKAGKAAHFEAELLKPYVRAQRQAIRDKRKMHETNAAVLMAANAESAQERIDFENEPDETAREVLAQFGGQAEDIEWQ